jgi:membrane peptidoglycan carboxypeptidase
VGSSGARSNGRTDAPGARGAHRHPDDGDRLEIKARLGAITGAGPAARAAIAGAGPAAAGPVIGRTSPAAGRGTRARAGLRPGQAYRDAPGEAVRAFDSFDDIVGFRGTTAQARSAALKDRAGTGRRVGTAGPAGRRGPGGSVAGGGSGGRGGGSRPRRKGSWWRHWTLTKALAVVAGAGAVMGLLVVVLVVVAYGKTQIPTDVSESALQQSSTVYFGNGKAVVGTFSTGTNRQLLTSAQIPAVLKNAVIAAEDRHFYTEGGISPTSILRAGYEDLTGGTFQGGSTITQQFVRNYYANIGTAQTMSRKLKEIFVAIKLSHEKSKDWILTQYLNTVFLGDEAYGVGAAAQTYFDRPALALNVAQSAMLAAMIQQPGYFSPDPHAGQAYSSLLARWHYVLANMVRDGALTPQQAAAQKFPKIVPGHLNDGGTGYRGYIMQAVRDELRYTYGYTLQDIDTGGLKIVTTFNQSMMSTLYKSVAEERQQMAADGSPMPSYVHIGALLEQPGTGAILAMYGGPGYGARHCLRLRCDYNMAMESSNQVGSSFKPYVLATAVSQGMDVQNSMLNGYSPIWIPPDWTAADRLALSTQSPPANPYGYWEFNEPGENSPSPLPVPMAAAISSDPAFEDLTHRVGVQNVLDMARNFGVAPTDMAGLEGMFGPHGSDAGSVTMALGQGDLTVEDQANTFAVLAAAGQYATPHVIAQITQNGRTIPPKIVHRQVLTPAQAADVDYALSFDNVPGGTAYPEAAWDRPIIAKTGTTNNAQSAFFIGSIPQYSLAVGMFTQNQSDHTSQTLDNLPLLPNQATGGMGGGWPATIWHTFMTNEFSQLSVDPLPTPDYTGFTQWIQAVPQPKPKPKPNPGRTTCEPRHGRLFGQPCPPQNPNHGASPGGTKSCSPAPGSPCPPTSSPVPPGQPVQGGHRGHGGQGAAITQFAQAAENPFAAAAPPYLDGG